MNITKPAANEIKVAVQTIMWGSRLTNIERVLDTIADNGFKGIEISQRPCEIGEPAISIDDLLMLMKERSLQLVGMAGGTIEERIVYCDDYRPCYLSSDHWVDLTTLQGRTDKPFCIALHPHLFKGIHRLVQAELLLRQHDDLLLIPDTAHFHIAGDSIADAIRNWFDRLAAIHFKDWHYRFGRTPFHYARGFAPLGDGVVDLGDTLSLLKSKCFSGWIVVEQDNPGTMEPSECLSRSSDWLITRGIIAARPLSSRRSHGSVSLMPETSLRPSSRAADPLFLQTLSSATGLSPGPCCAAVARAFHDLLSAHTTTLWFSSQSEEVLGLSAHVSHNRPTVIRMAWQDCLCGTSAVTLVTTVHDTADPSVAAKFGDPQYLNAHAKEFRYLISIPILNPDNPNDLWCIVNVLVMTLPSTRTIATLSPEFGRLAATAIAASVESECLRSVFSVHNLLEQRLEGDGPLRTVTLLQRFATLVRHTLSCEAVSIFVVDDAEMKLEPRASTHPIHWIAPDHHYYELGEGYTGRVWQFNESVFLAHRDSHAIAPRSFDKGTDLQRHDALLCPIRKTASGKVLGVLRCRNPHESGRVDFARSFSQVDQAIAETMCGSLSSTLEMLMAEERRVSALRKLVHEVGNPVVAVKATISELNNSKEIKDLVRRTFGNKDYLGDASTWCSIIARQVARVDLSARIGSGAFRPIPSRTDLISNVVAPVTRRVEHILRRRELRKWKINREGIAAPARFVMIDRDLFQEVFFNLFENAIKHGFTDPESLQIFVSSKLEGKDLVIVVQDYGPGIDKSIGSLIFEQGFRGQSAIERDVTGQGLGLWFVRRIIEGHGGTVTVTNCALPTEITITIPQ